MSDLKPCPFCGESPLEDRIEPHEHTTMILGHVPIPYSYPGSWSIECVKCECRIFSHESRERAAERWNRRSADQGRWVPWKPGDALPAGTPDERMIVTHTAHGAPAAGLAKIREFGACPVIAYWSIPLPPPYVPEST